MSTVSCHATTTCNSFSPCVACLMPNVTNGLKPYTKQTIMRLCYYMNCQWVSIVLFNINTCLNFLVVFFFFTVNVISYVIVIKLFILWGRAHHWQWNDARNSHVIPVTATQLNWTNRYLLMLSNIHALTHTLTSSTDCLWFRLRFILFRLTIGKEDLMFDIPSSLKSQDHWHSVLQ